MRYYVFLIALMAGLISGGGTTIFLENGKPVVHMAQAYAQTKPVQDRYPARLAARYHWDELSQADVNALAAELAKLKPRAFVIFCQEDLRCGELALDFDNAFESAHKGWKSRIEKPLASDAQGIETTSQDIADAVSRATKGRIKPVVRPDPRHDLDYLVIGAKLR